MDLVRPGHPETMEFSSPWAPYAPAVLLNETNNVLRLCQKSTSLIKANRWGNPMHRPPMRGPERDFPERNIQGSKLLCKTLCATLCAREKWLPRHCPVSLSGGPYAATLCARSIILFKETGYVQDESSLQAMICQRSVMTNLTAEARKQIAFSLQGAITETIPLHLFRLCFT